MNSAKYVLTIEAVKRAIEGLRSFSMHPFFPAYLHLRQRAAVKGTMTGISPSWKDLGQYLEVAGAPATKPYYRPFWEGTGAGGQEWLNSNLAGSFAGSSLRAGKPPLRVVDYDSTARTFSLSEKHWELARVHLLADKRVPIGFLFAFFLRDFAFQTEGSEPTAQDVVDLYRAEFGYGPDDQVEVDHLYDQTILDGGVGGWFGVVPDDAEGAEQ